MTLIGRASMPRPRRPYGHGHLVGAILSGPGPSRIPRSCPMREPPRNPFAITWTRSAGIRCRPAAPCAAGATLPSNSTAAVHLTPTPGRTDDRGMATYFTNVGPKSGPILCRDRHGAIGVMDSRENNRPIGMSLGGAWTDDGVAAGRPRRRAAGALDRRRSGVPAGHRWCTGATPAAVVRAGVPSGACRTPMATRRCHPRRGPDRGSMFMK